MELGKENRKKLLARIPPYKYIILHFISMSFRPTCNAAAAIPAFYSLSVICIFA
jgi:hypothetical protein